MFDKFKFIKLIRMRFIHTSGMQKGSITVEGSIAIPVIIASVIAVMYMGTLLCHSACLQSAADNAVGRGILAWYGGGGDVENGETEISYNGKQSLYRRIFDPKKKEKEAWLACCAAPAQGVRSILGEPEKRVNVELRNYLIFKKLAVTIEETYKPPFGNLLSVFGFGETYAVKARAEAIVDDPAEFIRNTDFILDVEKELEKKYPGLGSLADEVRKVMADIKEKIKKFFDG